MIEIKDDTFSWYGNFDKGWWAGFKTAEHDMKDGLSVWNTKTYWESEKADDDFCKGVYDYLCLHEERNKINE